MEWTGRFAQLRANEITLSAAALDEFGRDAEYVDAHLSDARTGVTTRRSALSSPTG